MRMRSGALAMALLAGTCLGADIYKWVDDKGVTHYSDAPQARDGTAVKPLVNVPAGPASTPAAKSWQQQELEFRERDARRRDAAGQEQQRQAAARRQAALRREQCLLARQNLETLLAQRAVYFIDEKGEREYLDDAARAAEIERVKAEIAASCAES